MGKYLIIQDDEFYHHGILGMKWGKRNGPPYPLSASSHSKSEQKAGWKKSLNSNKHQSRNKGLTDRQKKLIKIGAVTAGLLLASYGAYKLGANDYLGDFGLKGAQTINRILKINKGQGDFLNDIDDLAIASGFNKNSKKLSISESCAKVNPGYKTGKPGCKNNCFSAVNADILNRANNGQGLDVVARPAKETEPRGLSFVETLRPYEGSSIDDLIVSKDNKINAKDDISRKILKKCNNEDAYGIIRVQSRNNSSIGHFIKYEIVNGKVEYSDSLSGTMGADKYFNAIGDGRISRAVEFARVDKLAVNPFELEKLVTKSH